jgi:methionyl-tRNA formyltransferase
MKIIFMGTPEFSIPTLKTLIASEHEVVACYTQPDKPKGRGKKMMMPPVKEVCIEHNIPVYQPKRIRNHDEVERFASIDADIAVVIAYGQILPEAILSAHPYGCVNIHASLLPKYRGAAPYQWAVINGEQETGITTMQMDVGMDTGDMLLKTHVSMTPDETAGSLHDKLMLIGGPLILDTLKAIEEGSLVPEKQDKEAATYAPMLNKLSGQIDWTKPAVQIEQLIRGLNPWPSAYSFLGENLIKIWKASVENSNDVISCHEAKPGEICHIDKTLGIGVRCGEGVLFIQELQQQGKKRMSAMDYLNGHSLRIGDLFRKA